MALFRKFLRSMMDESKRPAERPANYELLPAEPKNLSPSAKARIYDFQRELFEQGRDLFTNNDPKGLRRVLAWVWQKSKTEKAAEVRTYFDECAGIFENLSKQLEAASDLQRAPLKEQLETEKLLNDIEKVQEERLRRAERLGRDERPQVNPGKRERARIREYSEELRELEDLEKAEVAEAPEELASAIRNRFRKLRVRVRAKYERGEE